MKKELCLLKKEMKQKLNMMLWPQQNGLPKHNTQWLKCAQREDKAAAAAQVERAKGAVAEVSSYIDERY